MAAQPYYHTRKYTISDSAFLLSAHEFVTVYLNTLQYLCTPFTIYLPCQNTHQFHFFIKPSLPRMLLHGAHTVTLVLLGSLFSHFQYLLTYSMPSECTVQTYRFLSTSRRLSTTTSATTTGLATEPLIDQRTQVAHGRFNNALSRPGSCHIYTVKPSRALNMRFV